MSKITIYTDGSCNTKTLKGCWAAIIFVDSLKINISGVVENTTNNRMELTAVLKAVEYIQTNYFYPNNIKVISDSQYVVNLNNRLSKIISRNFLTSKNKQITNIDLVKSFQDIVSRHSIEFIKIKAHQKKTEEINYNREIDILVRSLLRK